MAMPSAGSLHIIESSEASARLREAERWLAARADRGALIVSASRGAADEIARAVARGGLTGAEARARVAAQAPLAAKLAVADHVVDNAGSLGETKRQVLRVWDALLPP